MITISEAEEILKKEYHLDNFVFLVGEILLPDYKKDMHDVYFSTPLFESVKHLGISSKCDLSVFEVILARGSQGKRVTITQEMFKILRHLRINNAIVSFVNSDKENYRISLLTSKYEFDGDKIVKILSNPRRYSYSLGAGTKTKTAYKFLVSKGKVENIDELIGRFSVEVVNKQFYTEIATSFTELVGGERGGTKYPTTLVMKQVKDKSKFAEFAVRLIGRIVFCRFLCEKHSDSGLTLLPLDLFTNEKIKKSANYYHEVLEPLFFELLNTNQKRRKAEFVSDYFRQIPYLNGGLFSPHTDDCYHYDPVKHCGKADFVTIPNEWFIRFFSILNEYNFTVDENTSYDIELSIDPEMLGRIFENLLAEINPETGENAKKSTGSFYTPRDIVDFMVDSSLLRYLMSKTSIDEDRLRALIDYSKEEYDIAVFSENEKKSIINALYKITVLDPACGSGAFPIGMLQKIVYMLQELDPDAVLWFEKTTENIDPLFKKEIKSKFDGGSLNYIRKLSVIKNSIFGIDLQPIAVEISRLRCFLSLIIEEKVDDYEPNRGINPLPNLDFKFIIANSLVRLDPSEQISLFEDNDHINALKAVRDEYFNSDSERRAELKSDFKDIQQEMLLCNIGSSKNVSKRYFQLSAWKPFQNESTDWFDADWMFGIKEDEGFDIVIGNPPYIQLQSMKELSKTLYKPLKYYKSYEAMGDIYTLFYEMGLYNLNKNGVLCFITSNKWMRAGYGESLRDNVFQNYQTELLVDLGSGVFESATVDTNIILISNKKNTYPTKAITLDHSLGKSNMSDFIKQNAIEISFKKGESWVILTKIEQQIKEKIEKYGIPLGKWPDIKINYGIKTGCNEAFIISSETRADILKGCSSKNEYDKTDKIIRPILRGRDIKQGSYEWAGLYIINTHNGYRDSNGELVPRIDIKNYPSLKRYMDKYYEALKKRDDQGDTPYNLRSCAYMDDFDKQKIIFPAIMSKGPYFAFENSGALVIAPGNLITGPELESIHKYLMEIGYFALRKYYMGGGIEGELKVNRLELLPVPQNCSFQTANEIYERLNLTEEEIFAIKKYYSSLI